MSTWKHQEINILREFTQDRTATTKRDLEEAQNLLPGRSTAAIKKKYLEIKNPNQAEKQNTNKWSEAELDELVRAYKSRPEPLATARIRAICDNFPNRTQKAMGSKTSRELSRCLLYAQH